MTLDLFLIVLVNGITIGCLYVLVVVGLDEIVKSNSIINFTHGQLFLIGAYSFLIASEDFHLHFLLAFGFTCAVVIVLAGVMYLSVFDTLQRTFKAGVTMSTRFFKSGMASLGLMMIVTQGTLLTIGLRPRGMASIFPQTVTILNVGFPLEKLLLLPASLFILVGLYFFFYRTKAGKVLRAVSSDNEASSLLGIENRWVYTMGFMLGCVLAGLAGALVAPIFQVYHSMGDDIIFLACIVMTSGGIGNYRGAILGGLFVGTILSFGYLFIGGMANVLLYIMCLVLLAVRPGGLLGKVWD